MVVRRMIQTQPLAIDALRLDARLAHPGWGDSPGLAHPGYARAEAPARIFPI